LGVSFSPFLGTHLWQYQRYQRFEPFDHNNLILLFLVSCVTPPHTTNHSTTSYHRPHLTDVYNPTFATMQQPPTPHCDQQPDALAALAGLLSRAEVSGNSHLTAVVSTTEHDDGDNHTPPTLTRLAEELPDLFAREVLQRMNATTRAMLAETSRTFRAAVASSGLPRVHHGSERLKRKEFCNSVERLALAKSRGCPWDEDTCALVAEGGHLEVLVWAREHGCPWDGRTCACAASCGHLEVLVWAREHGCPWNETTCTSAVIGGHLEVLVWAREHGCPWHPNVTTCTYAALGGHLEVLVWAREHGCPWNESTCAHAALGGHLEVLVWAREHGCPWDQSTCAEAARGGHLEVLEWARAHGCP
jgi:hypothetical protein